MPGPDWCDPVDWVSLCKFHSQSGHVPGLWARSLPARLWACKKQIDVFFFSLSLFPSPSLLLSLKINLKFFLKKKQNKTGCLNQNCCQAVDVDSGSYPRLPASKLSGAGRSVIYMLHKLST